MKVTAANIFIVTPSSIIVLVNLRHLLIRKRLLQSATYIKVYLINSKFI